MPAVSPCLPNCCTESQTTDIPGSAGENAFGITITPFTIPAVGGSVGITIEDNSWVSIGQTVFISDGTDWGHFTVTSLVGSSGFVGVFLGQEGDSAVGVEIDGSAKVSPGGTQQDITLPLPIADGGTGAASKSAAIAALGVGQTPTIDSGASLAYDVTNSPAQITGMAAAVPTTGLYLILAHVTVLFTGVTFAGSRTLTLTVRNATAAANLVSGARSTNIHTTLSFPAIDYHLPFYVGSLTAGDSIQLFASLDTVESAGSTVITDASIVLIPIAL